MKLHRTSSHPQRRKLNLMQVTLLLALLGVCVVGLVTGTAQTTQENAAAALGGEREFKNTIPVHVPIKVKLKNEESFKRLNNERWARELEIEVTNTTDKPIYYMCMNILMRELADYGGYPWTLQVSYGRKELVSVNIPVEPDDVPIKPGESVVLTIPESQWKGFEAVRQKMNAPNPKKIEFSLVLINFGDGTGLRSMQGAPAPNRSKRQSRNVPFPKGAPGDSPPVLGARATEFSPLFGKISYLPAPASFLRVDFWY